MRARQRPSIPAAARRVAVVADAAGLGHNRAVEGKPAARLAAAERLLETAPRKAVRALEAIAVNAKRPDERSQASALLAMHHAARGSKRALKRAGEHLAVAERLAKTEVAHGRVAHARGHLAFHRHERDIVVDSLNVAAALYEGSARLTAQVFDTFGMHFSREGNLSRARDYFLESVRLKEQLGADTERYGLALTYGNLGRLEMALDDHIEAERWFRADLELVLEGPSTPYVEALVRTALATALRKQGSSRWDEAVDEADRAVGLAPAGSDAQAAALLELANVALASGELRRARACVRDARRVVQAGAFEPITYRLLSTEGDISAAESKSWADRASVHAVDAYNEALAGFDKLGLHRDFCDTAIAKARLLISQGRPSVALSELVESALPRAERHLFEQREPLSTIEALIEAIESNEIHRIRARRMLGGLPAEQHGARLRGVRHRVTVWTCDIRGFTSFCEETTDPREVCQMLNRFFATLGTRILDAGGRIDKYVGDNILAYFGRPESAAGIALAALAAVRVLNAERQHLQEPPLDIGIGLATGEIVEGNVGFAGKLEHTIIGTPVNLACRLVNRAEPGEVLVDAATRDALAGKFETEKVGRAPVPIKGLGRQAVYRLLQRAESRRHG